MQDRLLDAAEAVVVRQGIASLTLDAVATEAHMSKGGLLHNFPIEALVRRSAEAWRASCMNAYRRSAEAGSSAAAVVDPRRLRLRAHHQTGWYTFFECL